MQKLFQGSNCIQSARDSLHAIGCRNTMIVAGNSFFNGPLTQEFDTFFPKSVFFREFHPNPLYEEVCAGVEMFRSCGCDSIMAVGGGSALDVAKCIKLFCRMTQGENYLLQEFCDNGVPLVVLPTTAGTGSEATRFAVIYKDGEKQSVAHDSIIPDMVILKPSVLKTLPLYQKKCTMLDAICQGIESWWSVNSTPESRAFSKEAVSRIMTHWKEYLHDGSATAAEQIMLAANTAGKAINITQTTAPHAMSYKLTSMYKIPHGHAVALCLPEVWEHMMKHSDECIDPRGKEFLKQILQDISDAVSKENNIGQAAGFRSFLKQLDIDFPAVVREGDTEILASSVNPVRLKNNPVKLSREVLLQMYKNITSQ